jgi:HD-GYP domain-containing protein (c-di-GMP phosphodiesterase class II)
MKTHVTEGLRVIDDVIAEVGATPFLSTVRDVVAGHHERYDGRGYPFGMASDAIPRAGRLMAVADVYDALRSARVYKPAMSREEARRIIEDGAGSHFDPRIVAAFLAVEPEIHRISSRFSDEGMALDSGLAA